MKKLYLSFMLTLSMMTLSFNAAALSGGGTEGNPYEIWNINDLNEIRSNYLNQENVYFKMRQDIDFNGYDWNNAGGSIGSDENAPFKGVFDGNGYTIKNLTGNSGLFGRLRTPGVIKNLTIENATITAGSWTGVLISTNGVNDYVGGTISYCTVKNSTISGVESVGGLAGVNTGTIEYCAAIDVNVLGRYTGDSNDKATGGLVGDNGKSTSLITNCYSSGIVNGVNQVGGLVGHHTSETVNAIENCYSFAYVNSGTNVGGLIGYCDGKVKNCFASGNVEGISAGGLIGAPLTKDIENCYATGNVLGKDGANTFNGGLNGAAYGSDDVKLNFTNCYFNGTLEGLAQNRAITGRAIKLNFTNCYFNSTSANTSSGYQDNENCTGTITPLSDANMKKASSFTGLLNDAAWTIWEDNSAPYFAYQSAPPTLTTVRTTIISGTYRTDFESIKIYTENNKDVQISLSKESGSWTATIAAGEINAGEQVNVILKEAEKSWSYAVYSVAVVAVAEWSPQGSSTVWDADANWSNGKTPAAVDHVIIPVSGSYPAISSGTPTVASLTMNFGSQINITGSATLTAGKVSVYYPIRNNFNTNVAGDDKRIWIAIGFPFDADNMYCPDFEDDGYSGDQLKLIPHDPDGADPNGDFWLKKYNGSANTFDYVIAIPFVKDQGYIIQFPVFFKEIDYTAVFESSLNASFENASVSAESGTYKLVANPTLGEIKLTNESPANVYYYKYDKDNNHFKLISGEVSIAPFESFICVKKPDSNFSLRSAVSLDEDAPTLLEAINEVNDPVVEKRYYTLQGVAINNLPDNGIYLVRKIHESGKTTIQKVFNAKNN